MSSQQFQQFSLADFQVGKKWYEIGKLTIEFIEAQLIHLAKLSGDRMFWQATQDVDTGITKTERFFVSVANRIANWDTNNNIVLSVAEITFLYTKKFDQT